MTNLDQLARDGKEKVLETKRDLLASEVRELIISSHLNGTDELIDLIARVYFIGFEKGYKASQSKAKKNRRVIV